MVGDLQLQAPASGETDSDSIINSTEATWNSRWEYRDYQAKLY